MKCPVCDNDHEWQEHPSLIGRLMLVCGKRSVLEVWAKTIEENDEPTADESAESDEGE